MKNQLDNIQNLENSDLNFSRVIQLFSENNIPYWICHGTLLGIIRDNKLIEWDHDIDLAVWSNEVKKEFIKKIMSEDNFKLRPGYPFKDNGILSFEKKGGRIVDINFYEQIKSYGDQELAYVKWYIPKNFFMKLIDALSQSSKYRGKYAFLINMLSSFQGPFERIKNLLIKKNFFYKECGYSEPLSTIGKLKTILYEGKQISIPIQPESYLKYLYGNNWRIPKKNFVWYKDAKSIISSKNK